MKLPKAWFLPEDHDVLGMLRTQLDIVAEVRDLLDRWARLECPTGRAVRELQRLTEREHAQRRALHAAVRASFSTPLEAEDVFELGERLGELVEATYALVREAELSRTEPEPRLTALIASIVSVMPAVDAAVRALPSTDAANLADRAGEQRGTVEHAYREAIADLEYEPDLRRELRRRELYRRAEHLALATQRLGRRTWYAVCKTQ